MFKTKPQRPPPIPPVKKEGKESEPRHHIISYYDPTGVWGLVAAGIQARLPIKEARWKTNAVIRKLNLDIVNFDGKAPLPSSQHVSNLYNAPFVNIMILNGDVKKNNVHILTHIFSDCLFVVIRLEVQISQRRNPISMLRIGLIRFRVLNGLLFLYKL